MVVAGQGQGLRRPLEGREEALAEQDPAQPVFLARAIQGQIIPVALVVVVVVLVLLGLDLQAELVLQTLFQDPP